MASSPPDNSNRSGVFMPLGSKGSVSGNTAGSTAGERSAATGFSSPLRNLANHHQANAAEPAAAVRRAFPDPARPPLFQAPRPAGPVPLRTGQPEAGGHVSDTLRFDPSKSVGASTAAQPRAVSEMQYRRFAAFLEEKIGIVLGPNKHYLVNSRITPLLARFGITNIDELLTRAMDHGKDRDITDAVLDAMTTNETLWFRDTYPYLALKNMILPDIAKKGRKPCRIWSAACSSGQEPYSIAMVILEQAAQMVKVDPADTQIIATDISPEMLEKCRSGLYDRHALARGLSAERKTKFFKSTNDPNVMRIDDRVKQLVTFRQMNLLGSYVLLGRFDVIFCRNVLIYFNNEVKSQILNKFAMSLNPGGFLILGSSESISGLTERFEMVRCNPGLAYRLKS